MYRKRLRLRLRLRKIGETVGENFEERSLVIEGTLENGHWSLVIGELGVKKGKNV
jgi:hypothetical protein